MAKAKRRSRSLGNPQHRGVRANLDARDTLGYEVGHIIKRLTREEGAFDRALKAKDCQAAAKSLHTIKGSLRALHASQVAAAEYGVSSAKLKERERYFSNMAGDATHGFNRRCPRW